MARGDQPEPGIFEIGESHQPPDPPEPRPGEIATFSEMASDRHYHHLIDKGYTPHQIESSGPLIGVRSEVWWDRGQGFDWPMSVTLIGFMVFLLGLVKGVPW